MIKKMKKDWLAENTRADADSLTTFMSREGTKYFGLSDAFSKVKDLVLKSFNNSAEEFSFFNILRKGGFQVLKYPLFAVVVLSFMGFPSIACGAEPDPAGGGGDGKLPFGIFPLSDVRWEHAGDTWFHGRKSDSVYDADGKLIKVISYVPNNCRLWTITYSVRQIGENRAELYSDVKETWRAAEVSDKVNGTTYKIDTTIIISPKLNGEITIEGKKVYYSYGVAPYNQKVLLYDFNLKVGDTFYVGANADLYDKIPFVLVSIDSALVGNEHRKRYNFAKSKESEYYNFSVIEGIGCTPYLFYSLSTFLHEELPMLYRVYHKGQLIWGGE